MRALLVAMFVAPVAYAEPASSVEQLTLASLVRTPSEEGFTAGVFAATVAVADTAGSQSSVVVGGQLSTTGHCKRVELAGAVLFPFAATTRAASCLHHASPTSEVWPGFSIAHALDYDVRPALTEQRVWLRRTVNRQSFDIDASLLEAGRGDGSSTGALFPLHVDVDIDDQEDRY